MLLTLSLLLASLVGLGACDSEEPVVDRGAWAAVVYGDVEEADGIPAPGIALEFNVYADSACTRSMGREPDPVRSDSTGAYRAKIIADSPEAPCLGVEAVGETDAVGDTSFTVRPLDVELRRQAPFDSVRVDVTVPGR